MPAIACPTCAAVLICSSDSVGKLETCPRCGQPVRITSPGLSPDEIAKHVRALSGRQGDDSPEKDG